jgi:2,3-dihydroxy-p-cumate/2,3-dihydroxybenzoate 3,4-dioxygenase
MGPLTFRYRGLAGATLNVTDLARSVEFYRNMVGLELVEQSPDHAVFRCSDRWSDLTLCSHTEAGLKRVAFELETEADWKAAKDHFASLGLAIETLDAETCAKLRQGNTFRLREPRSGLQFEFLVDGERATVPFSPSVAKFTRVGHVVIEVADLDSMLEFLLERANFRTSDYVEGKIHFLRCFPNPLHHSFAVQQGRSNQLHHINFMVSDIDDVGRAMNRMRKAEVPIVFGPGRHEPSGSIFIYFLDPDRMTLEYSFGMEEFPEDAARDARSLNATAEVLDVWGSVPSPDFAKVGAIEIDHA